MKHFYELNREIPASSHLCYKEQSICGTSTEVYLSFRKVVVDEWIEYAKQKPTHEDFEPTGNIQVSYADGKIGERNPLDLEGGNFHRKFWRRITPPEQPKPKSIDITLKGSRGNSTMEVFTDGRVKAPCGDEFPAESIDEFIKQRNLVMKKD